MKLKVLGFGIAKDILGQPSIEVDIDQGSKVEFLKDLLERKYPKLKELSSYTIALNNEFSLAGDEIHPGDEIAIIPPVSGG